MRRESHVRFCERAGVKLPRATHLVVLVSGTQEDAIAEKSALAEHLRETTGLELSPEKTKVTAMTDGFEFLGFHVTMRWDKRYGVITQGVRVWLSAWAGHEGLECPLAMSIAD